VAVMPVSSWPCGRPRWGRSLPTAVEGSSWYRSLACRTAPLGRRGVGSSVPRPRSSSAHASLVPRSVARPKP